MLHRRLVLEWIVIALLAILLATGAVMGGWTQRFDNLLLDVTSPLRAPPVNDRILIVEIDNRSLAQLGKWPWPRTVHAQAIARLQEAGVKLIAYDILFIEPGDADGALAGAMAGGGAPVLLPLLFETPGDNGAAHNLHFPPAPIARAAAGLGTVNLLFDTDGLVRRAQIATNVDGRTIPHLMEVGYRAITGRSSPAFRSGGGDSVLIPFHKAGTFPRTSFASVARGEVPQAFLRDRIVLVGASAEGMGDVFPVPASAGSVMPGIEIQANLLNGLIADRYIMAAPSWAIILVNLLPVLLLLAAFWRFRPAVNLRLSLAMLLLLLLFSAVTVMVGGRWIPPGPGLLALLVIYPLWGWRRLEAASHFMAGQIASLRMEPGLLKPLAPRSGEHMAAGAAELGAVIEELRRLRRLVSDVMDDMPDALFVLDGGGALILTNPAGAALIGSNEAEVKALFAAAAPDIPAEIDWPDGRCFHTRLTPFHDGGTIVRLADISAMRAAAREREEVLQFLSHDMRAPQAAIVTMLEGETGALADRIRHHARHALKLADDFVQLARLQAAPVEDEPVDLADAMAEAADLVWAAAREKGVTLLCTSLAGREFWITGDRAVLVRAFLNLLDNAVKFSPAGGTVRYGVSNEEGHVHCVVSDSGPGLPPERVRDPFARFGMRDDAGRISGAGLGLAFVRAAAERHGGVAAYDPMTGRGARFSLQIPRSGARNGG